MPKRPTGRPSNYTPELAAELCAYLAAGESLRTACARDSMPCTKTVFVWLHKHVSFAQQYARAKQESADAFAEEILDIADDGTNDWMERSAQRGGGYEVNGEHIQRSRVRIDTRKWLASKLKPKKYGDRVEVEHGGSINHTSATSLQEAYERLATVNSEKPSEAKH